MAIGMYFAPESMTAEQYDEATRRLEAAGQGAPEGRLYHTAFYEGDKLRVFDVWESQETFDRFGETLMPILAEIGIDPGPPGVTPIHNIIEGKASAQAGAR